VKQERVSEDLFVQIVETPHKGNFGKVKIVHLIIQGQQAPISKDWMKHENLKNFLPKQMLTMMSFFDEKSKIFRQTLTDCTQK